MSFSLRLSAFAAAGCVFSLCPFPVFAQESSIPTITVYPLRPLQPATRTLNLFYDPPLVPWSDSADYLRSLPGVSASRFGGHGLEPFIRGQSMTQLDIRLDGANVHGGCPNRMDPPTAYAALETFDTVKVTRGYQTVTEGPGAPGGRVSLERKAPGFYDDKPYNLSFSSGYTGNGDLYSSSADLSVGGQSGYVRAYGAFRDSGNYEDGNGKTVRSAFHDESAGTRASWSPDSSTRMTIGYDANRIEDALFPGSSMDAPLSDSDLFLAQFERSLEEGLFSRIETSVQAALVDHIMDNYSLRDPTPGNYSRATSRSDVYGGKLRGDLRIEGVNATLGFDLRRTDRDAERRRGTTESSVTSIQSILWPRIVMDEAGLSAEVKKPLGLKNKLVFGVRYDWVHVQYDRADEITDLAPHTPDSLYRRFYGYESGNVTEHNLGGLIRLEHDVSAEIMLFSGISRSVRTADATERGIASRMVMGSVDSSWVGNPGIEPEKHHQLDAGISYRTAAWSMESTLYANVVQDYILKDSARGEDGILVDASSATVYRNIDAFLGGLETQGRWEMGKDLTLHGDLALTYGQDLDAGQALPQIPPLSGTMGVLWKKWRWDIGGDMRWAFRQGRVDTDKNAGTGRDVRKTPGYAVFDLHASTRQFRPLEISFGVSNLFNKTYANHLNRSNLDDPSEVQVNEPGRSVFFRIGVRF